MSDQPSELRLGLSLIWKLPIAVAMIPLMPFIIIAGKLAAPWLQRSRKPSQHDRR